MNINPTELPVIVNGGFREKTTDTILDPMHARCLVMDDGKERIAIVVVDSCMVPRELLDQAKAIASKATGIRADRMLISSTHTHSAPSAMGALGSDADPNYVKELPDMIAEGIKRANDRLQPARVGWAVIDAPEHTNCRRWILRGDKMRPDPFGETTVRAHMHPGHQNPDFIGPSGPVDTGLTLLSLQTPDGKPLAMFANFSMHYYGSGALSADYCGAFSEEFAKQVGAGDGRSDFVAAMSQGTSGDLQWMDYSAPRPVRDVRQYASELAAIAKGAYETIQYRTWAPLAMAETKLKLRRRVANEKRLAWARPIAASLTNRKPKTQQEIYAREQVMIAADPERELILQAARVGDLGITAIPNEVYSITGLKLKAQSPLQPTMNIELANGGEGYIPPPEQHRLGGYTTWEARTASLETNAEPKIVETLLTLLEKVAGKPRREFTESHGSYAKAILAAKPLAYWRMEDAAGEVARDSSGNGNHAGLQHGLALHLEGAEGNGFCQSDASNRSIQFAGGGLNRPFKKLKGNHSVEFWFWNGVEPASGGAASILYARGDETLALVHDNGLGGATLELTLPGDPAPRFRGNKSVATKTWRHVALVHQGAKVSLSLDGEQLFEARLNGKDDAAKAAGRDVSFAQASSKRSGFEGRLDEVAVYDRALSREEIQSHYQLSGISAWREEKAIAARKAAEALARQMVGPEFDGDYARSVAALKPAIHWSFDEVSGSSVAAGGSRGLKGAIEGGVETGAGRPARFAGVGAKSSNLAARFNGGRVKTNAKKLPLDYSVSLWFRNDQPNASRAVTAYLFSRGPDGDKTCPGDHFGIGGTYRNYLTGKLIIFNGNRLDQVVAGKTTIQPGTWNHAVMARNDNRVKVWLNGNANPEIDAELPTSIGADETELFFGGRNDNFANLNGFLDETAVFDRALSGDEAVKLYAAAKVKAPTPAQESKPAIVPLDSDPLGPAEGLKTVHVPEGFVAELVAAEPLTLDPVAIDWDVAGRLWVVEMADYPNGMDDNGKPGGRVRVLTDKDGDGRYDESKLFVDGLNFPAGVMPWKKGALIAAAPKIIYAEDTDGDGRADTQKTMYEGFFEGNQQLRVNGLRWGLDNWIHCANGSHRPGYGGAVKIRSHNGETFLLGSHDFRIHPAEGALDTLSGPSQYGRERNDWGDWFGEQNSYPIWHYVIEDRYLQRNPDATFDSPKKNLTRGNPEVFPAKAPQKRFHSFTQSGRYTSACSVMVYRDSLLFGADGPDHGFTCEPFHNLVQHYTLTDDGVSYAFERGPKDGKFDFFASTDRWCRPVQVRTGPDGAVWVVDMYRYMIEHPQWLPPNGREELRPHYRKGEDKGRIYRVYRKDSKPRPIMDLTGKGAEALVRKLADPAGMVRDLVHHELIERGGTEAVPALRKQLAECVNPLGRLHSLCALEGLGQLTPADLTAALKDKHPGVRRRTVLLLESLSKEGLKQAVSSISFPVTEDNAKVSLQWALTLGELEGDVFGAELGRLAAKADGEPYMRMAVLSSTPRHYDAVANAVAANGGPKHPLFFDLLQMGSKRPARLPRLLESLTAADANGAWSAAQMTALSRWLDSLRRESLSLEGLAKKQPAVAKLTPRVDAMLNAARKRAGDAKLTEADRVAAFPLLGKQPGHRAADLALLTATLNPQYTAGIQTAAVKAILSGWGGAGLQSVAGRWTSLAPTARLSVVNEALNRGETTTALLGQLEAGVFATSDLTADQRQRLTKHGNKNIRARAVKALKGAVNADRQKVVENFRPALRLKGDLANGKVVFDKLCAVCHQPPTGDPVGPDLRSITDKSPDGLLVAILDPNQTSDPSYNAYNIDLKDDTALSGRVISESGSSLTVATADGAKHVILRSQIASFSGGRLSLMPEGLEQGVTKQDIADVIAYVREGLK